ncbi:hypothetical protein [Euzebya tangerina]|uniref:hypothetical protein n=1 Tax=Euzebya tangerina TaxID=591198 RepID=UPI000E321EFD|nr:hypothetical protein [Euzebya tangerina]
MKTTSVPLRLLGLLLILALVAAACGGGDEGEATEAAESTEGAAATEEPAATEDAPAAETAAEATPAEEAGTPTPTPTPTPKPEETTEPPAPTAEPIEEVPTEAAPADDPKPEEDVAEAMDVGGETSYDSYTVITDDAGTIEVEVPTEWDEVDGRPFTDDAGRQLFDVRTAPDLEGFLTTWEIPGIIITASSDVAQSANEITLLDELVEPLSAQCTYLGREPYDDGLYTGQADIYDLCGGTETGYVVIGAVPNTRAFVIRVEVQVTAERDLEALGRAIETFRVIGDV